MNIVIRPLSSDLRDHYLGFFDRDAFADNPRWQYCYCNFVHHDHAERPFGQTAPPENREAVSLRIQAGAMQGYLAYVDNVAVGWCQAAPRSAIPALVDEPDPDGSAGRTGSIVCFVVTKPFRGQGVATRLLSEACVGFERQGFEYAEAYPRENLATDAENHFGPLSMYLKAGFERYRTDDDGTVIVRRKLIS